MGGVFFGKKVGYYENEKCFYMPWEPVGEWKWLGDDFVELSPYPSTVSDVQKLCTAYTRETLYCYIKYFTIELNLTICRQKHIMF